MELLAFVSRLRRLLSPKYSRLAARDLGYMAAIEISLWRVMNLIAASKQWNCAVSCCHHQNHCNALPLTSGHASLLGISRYEALVSVCRQCASCIQWSWRMELPTRPAQNVTFFALWTFYVFFWIKWASNANILIVKSAIVEWLLKFLTIRISCSLTKGKIFWRNFRVGDLAIVEEK